MKLITEEQRMSFIFCSEPEEWSNPKPRVELIKPAPCLFSSGCFLAQRKVAMITIDRERIYTTGNKAYADVLSFAMNCLTNDRILEDRLIADRIDGTGHEERLIEAIQSSFTKDEVRSALRTAAAAIAYFRHEANKKKGA